MDPRPAVEGSLCLSVCLSVSVSLSVLDSLPAPPPAAGVYYRGFVDCFSKVAKTEGLHGLYKGAFAAYFRLAPQAVLGLSFWDGLRRVYIERFRSES
jgi:hypothetical protein